MLRPIFRQQFTPGIWRFVICNYFTILRNFKQQGSSLLFGFQYAHHTDTSGKNSLYGWADSRYNFNEDKNCSFTSQFVHSRLLVRATLSFDFSPLSRAKIGSVSIYPVNSKNRFSQIFIHDKRERKEDAMASSSVIKAIGLDIGTTTISSVFTSGKDLTVEESATIPNNSFLPKRAEWESLQDPLLITETVRTQLDKILSRHPDTQVIGLTGQMHGIVYIGADGTPVSPLATWQDRRGNVPCFEGKSICELLQERCGVRAFTGYGFVTHLFNVLSGNVPDGAESFGTIGDCIGMLLTGRKKPLLHSSNAASLGLYDAEKNCFDARVLKEFGVREELIPAVTPDYTCIGSYNGIPVCTAIGDNQASFLGTVRQAKETVLVNMGTGGQISVFSRKSRSAPGNVIIRGFASMSPYS